MEVPSEVLIHNELLGVKGSKGSLIAFGDGYYEVNLSFGPNTHRVLFPVAGTVVISQEAEQPFDDAIEIER